MSLFLPTKIVHQAPWEILGPETNGRPSDHGIARLRVLASFDMFPKFAASLISDNHKKEPAGPVPFTASRHTSSICF
jgi:hypothetical protein